MFSVVEKRNHRAVTAVLLTSVMAAPFLRVGRLSEQRLRMERSFDILRRMPSVVNFSAKAGEPKKPVRYTSIKKAKPKTIIDIGKLLLQRANEAKTSSQSVIAEAALKAATQAARPSTLKQSAASGDSAGPTSANTSGAVSRPPVASGVKPLKATRLAVNAVSEVSDAMKPSAKSKPADEYLYKVTTSEEKGVVSKCVSQDTSPKPTITNNIPPPAFTTSFETSTAEIIGSTPVYNNSTDETSRTSTETPESGAEAVPIDVTLVASSVETLKATRLAVNAVPEVSDAMKPPAKSKPANEYFYKVTTSEEKGVVSEGVSQETSPKTTSSETSTGEKLESTPVYNNSTDEISSTSTATPESGAKAVPIDVTYSEDVTPVNDNAGIRVASMEPSIGVLSTTGTLTANIVANSVDASVAPESIILEHSSEGHSSTKDALAPELPPRTAQEVVATGAFTDLTKNTVQDFRSPLTSETLTDPVYTAFSSKILFEEGTDAHEITPGAACGSTSNIAMTGPEVSPLVPPEEIMSSFNVAIEQAVISDSVSRVLSSDRIPEDSTSTTETNTEKVPEVTPMTAVAQSVDPVNAEVVEEELILEEDEAFKKSSEAQLDPIQRLFLDKIREYSTKSKAHDGLLDADPEYAKAFSEELTKLQRLYGNGDLTAFPEFKFPEPVLDETNSK